jgi:hypothetical protein
VAKVRVPKHLRPPERYEAYKIHPTSAAYALKEGMFKGEYFKVAGTFRAPRLGEFFWDTSSSEVWMATFDFPKSLSWVIMIPCNPDGSALAQAPEAPQ